jgi:hypothetical protein
VLTAPSGHVGDTVTITGTGFAAGSGVTPTYGGSLLLLVPAPTTSSSGSFSGTFTVPTGTAGVYTVAATDSFSNSANATFTLTPQIVLTGGSLGAASGYVGDTVTITGTGFAATSNIGTHTYDGAALTLSPATPQTNSSGGFTATFTVPASAAGGHTVLVTDGATNSASATLTVNPKITLTPTSGSSGSTDSIAGTGFAASSALSATFNATSALTLGGTTSTDATGSFSAATYTVPYIGSGSFTVLASDASSHSASASYTIQGAITSRASTAWNLSSTWLGSTKTGTITTSTSSATVTGSGTKFPTELRVGDAIYLGDGTTLIGTVASITNATTLTLQANAASTNSGVAYTGSRVPTAFDAVTIAAGNAVTVPAAYAASAQSLLIGPASAAGSQSVALLANTSSLTVSGNVDLTQPTNANNTQLIVDAGAATIGGNLDLNSTATNANKCDRVRITTGMVTVSGNLNVNDPNQNSAPACTASGGFGAPGAITQIDMSGGAGTLNLAGALTVAFPAVQAAGLASTTTSTIVFNGTSAQTIPVPTSAKWAYGAVNVTNTSVAGVSFGASSVAGDFTGNLTIGSGVLLSAGSFSEVFGGNFTNNGTFSAGSGAVTLAGSSPETIGGASSTAFNNLTVNGTSTVTLGTSGTVTGNLTVSGGTFDLGANTLPGSGGTLTVGSGDTLKIGGTNGFPSGYTTHSLDPASTINYSGTSQTVSNESYGNLTLSGSGTVTMPSGALSIASALTTSGTQSATAQAAVTVGGAVTIGSGTTFATGAFADSIGGNFTNNGTFTATGSTITLNGTGAQSIGGSSTTSFANLTVSKSSGTATLAANESVWGNLSVSQGTLDVSTFTFTGSGGTFSLAAGTTLNVGGASNFPSGFGSVSLDPASTVAYNGAGQTVSSKTYGNLTLSGSGTKTAAAGVTVAGTFTIGSGTTFAAGSFTHSFAGNFTNNGTFTAGTSNATFNGTGAQTIGGSSTTTFGTLTLNNATGTVTLAQTESATNLTVSAGTLDLSTFALTGTGAGTLTVGNGATLKIGGTNGFPAGFPTHSLNAGSTVNYYGTTQSVSGESYGNLVAGDSGTATLAATGTVAGNLTVSSGTLALGAFTLNRASSGGTLTLGSGATLSIGGANGFPVNYTTHSLDLASTVVYNGTTQSVSGESYGNLTVSTSGAATLAATGTVAGNLSVSSGTLDLSTFTLNRATGGGTLIVSNGATLAIGGTNGFPANYSTHILGATSTVNYYGTTQSVSAESYGNLTVSASGTATLAATGTVAGNLTVSSGSLTLGAFTLNGSGSGTFSLANGTTLRVGGASNFPTGYATTSLGASSTVRYDAAGDQTVSVQPYGNLVLSGGAGTKTAAGALTVAGDVTINAGATFAAATFSHSFAGNFTDNGTLSAGTSTITLNGAGAQSIGGSSTATFNNLTVSKTSGTVTLSANESVGNNLSLSAGTLDLSSFTLNGGGAGAFSAANGATLLVGGAANFPSSYGTTSLGASSTVNYYAAGAQSVAAVTYGNLTFSGTGTKTAAGGVTVAATTTIGSGTTFDGSTFTHFFAGNFTDNGAFASAGTATLNGSTAQSIGGSSTTTFNNLTVSSGNTVSLAASQSAAGNLTVSSGTLDLATFTLNRTSAGGTLTVSNGATLAIGGTSTTFPANYTTHSLGATSTVNYKGASQTVTNESYGNLALSGSGTVTMPAGALSIAGTFTTSGTESATAQAAVTVGSDVTIGSGTTFTTGAFTDSFAGSFTNNGTFTATGGTVVLNGTGAEAIGGTSTTSFNNLTLSNSTTAITAAANFNVGGTFTLSSGAVFTPAAAVVINNAGAAGTITGSGTAQVTSTSASGYSAQYKFTTNTLANLTVDYSSSSAQTIVAVAYGNLKTSGNATKTAPAGLTVTGDVTIGSGSTFAASSFSHSFAGNFTDNGTFTSTGTVTFNGTGAQAIGGSTTTVFSSVTINKSSGTASLTGSATAAANLTVTAGTLDLSTFTFNRATAGGTLTVSSGATLRVGGASNFPTNYTTVSLASGSTVEYYASSAQTIASTTYGNLLLTGSATKTAGGALTVAGNLTIGSGSTFAASTFSHAIGGNWSNSGTFTAGTSTVTLNGSSGQTLTGATTFNNLTLNDAGGFTLSSNETVGSTLTLTSGVVATGANTLIVSTGGTVSRTSGYVNGTEQRGFNTGAGQSATFDVGTASTYSPISVASLTVTSAGSLTASSTAAQQPNYASSALSQTQYVKRYWTLTPAGGLVVSGYNATGNFVAGDLTGSPNTSNLAQYRYSGGAWTAPTSWSSTGTTATGTSFGTGFGDFASGIPPATQLVFTTQPAGAASSFALLTQPQVTVEDAMGKIVTGDSSTAALSITSGTPTSGGPGAVSGCSQSETNGVITFSSCAVTGVGNSYKLHATDGTLTAADSSSFNVTSIATQALGSPTTVAGGGATSFTTNAYTATSGSVVLVIVSAHESTATPTLSVSGGPTSGSFHALPSSVVKTASGPGDASAVQEFWALGTSTTAAFTVTGAAAITDADVQVLQIFGANTSAPIVGTPVTSTGTNGTSATATFPAPAAGDMQILTVSAVHQGPGGGGTTITQPGGFTEYQDSQGGSGGTTQTLESSYTLSAVTGTVTATIGTSDNWGTIGIEVQPFKAPQFTSANHTTFTAGQSGTFTVTTVGQPAPALTNAAFSGCTPSTLPGTVTFTDNGNGTATIAGNPGATTGSYTLCLNATSTAGSATQAYTLTVGTAPAITSGTGTTFTSGTAGGFTVTTSGFPAPALTNASFTGCTKSTLPGAVSFTDNGNGTATIASTTAVIAGGTYTICINAANGVGSAATQTFTLTVNAAPAFTSGSSTTFNTNVGGSFNVTTSGFPNPTLTNAAFAGCTPSTLPGTVTFADNSNGTGTISGNPGSSSGTYTLCLDASNGIGSAATQTFTLTVQPFTITGIYFTNITTSGTQNCSSQTVSQNITCTDGGMGGAGTFTANVEMVNSSGTPITNTSGGAITVSCSQTTVSSPGGTVSPSSSTIANGAVTTASTFTLTGGGAGWSGKMTCSVVVNSTTYTIAVTGS